MRTSVASAAAAWITSNLCIAFKSINLRFCSSALAGQVRSQRQPPTIFDVAGPIGIRQSAKMAMGLFP